jgi:F-box/WD-40 domain protein MET30
MPTSTDPHTALMQGHDHEHASERSRHLLGEKAEETEEAQASKSKKMEKMITPYLAQHIPQQYNPLGGPDALPGHGNTKFCYRHRPDLLCRRQADEPSMEQLQQVRLVVHPFTHHHH